MEHGYSLGDFINSLDELQKEDPHGGYKKNFSKHGNFTALTVKFIHAVQNSMIMRL